MISILWKNSFIFSKEFRSYLFGYFDGLFFWGVIQGTILTSLFSLFIK